jgi:hypothetical protein
MLGAEASEGAAGELGLGRVSSTPKGEVAVAGEGTERE